MRARPVPTQGKRRGHQPKGGDEMKILAIAVSLLALSNVFVNLSLSLLHKRLNSLQRLLLAILTQKIADDQAEKVASNTSPKV